MSTYLPSDPDKRITDMTKQDLSESLRFGRWFSSLWCTEISKFVGCEIKSVFSLKKTYCGDYYRNIICLSLRDYLKENKFTIVDECVVGSDDFSSVKKEEIEISKNKFKDVTIEGLIFMERNGKHFVLGMNEGYGHNKEWIISISYDKNHHDEIKSLLTDLEKYCKDRCYLQGAKIDPALSFIDLNKTYTWNDVILPRYVKEEIKLNTTKLVNNIDFYKRHNLPFKRGLILEGVPGTGKTLIGRILCSDVNCSFLWVTPKFLQDSKAIAGICELARQIAPCILFLEDLDLYAADRDDSRDAALLGELMNQLDGLVENNYVIVIATTNRVKLIEKALSNRPGRFDRTIEIPLPSEKGRQKLLQLCLKDIKLKQSIIDEVAAKTNEFTGSHIQELVNTAIMVAIDVGSVDHDGHAVLKKEFLIDNIQKVKNKKLEPSLGFDNSGKNKLEFRDLEDDFC